jgi:hypothetical protein
MRNWTTSTNAKGRSMISKIISRTACLAELTSNPKSFYNCPDLHGGSGLPGDWKLEDRSWELGDASRTSIQKTQPQQWIY